MEKIILFDGECNFCDQSVQFIIKRDPHGRFKFASLQGETGKKLLKQYRIPKGLDSFILLAGEKYYCKSAAALETCKSLAGLWKLLYIFIAVPRPIRDWLYDILARNRYRWFGKKDHCLLPSPEMRRRFLD